jgi:hypothetical protein
VLCTNKVRIPSKAVGKLTFQPSAQEYCPKGKIRDEVSPCGWPLFLFYLVRNRGGFEEKRETLKII